jgi:hypothetical protein
VCKVFEADTLGLDFGLWIAASVRFVDSSAVDLAGLDRLSLSSSLINMLPLVGDKFATF